MARILSQSDQYRGLIKVPSNAIANKTSNLRPTLGTLLLALLATWCISLLRFAGSADPIWLVGEVLLLSGFCCLVRLVWMPRFGARFFTGHPSSSKLWVWGIGACLILTPWFSRWVLMGLFGSSGRRPNWWPLRCCRWQDFGKRPSQERPEKIGCRF